MNSKIVSICAIALISEQANAKIDMKETVAGLSESFLNVPNNLAKQIKNANPLDKIHFLQTFDKVPVFGQKSQKTVVSPANVKKSFESMKHALFNETDESEPTVASENISIEQLETEESAFANGLVVTSVTALAALAFF